MSTFAEQLNELIKDTVNDLIDDKIEDANSNINDDIENMKYECEQMIDSYLSDIKSDLGEEVKDTVEDIIDDKLQEFKNNTLKVSDDDMRVLKDYMSALLDERLRVVVTSIYHACMKELHGYVQSTPPYKGD
jgi:preprotein translocase subunit SecA